MHRALIIVECLGMARMQCSMRVSMDATLFLQHSLALAAENIFGKSVQRASET
jgi:histone H3/H4